MICTIATSNLPALSVFTTHCCMNSFSLVPALHFSFPSRTRATPATAAEHTIVS